MNEKEQIRARVKSLFDQYSDSELSVFSNKICSSLQQIIQQKKIRKIMVFAPLEKEPNIWPVIDGFFEKDVHFQKMHIFFPRILKNEDRAGGEIEIVQVRRKAELEKGTFGILEPRTDLPALTEKELSQLDSILLPGVAFDKDGNRLGRGGGYYDRFLAKISDKSLKIGVCFPFQLLEKIPINSLDQKVDVIVVF